MTIGSRLKLCPRLLGLSLYVMSQFPCRSRRGIRSTRKEEEEEEEAVFISLVNTNEDPPNAHQTQHRPKEEEEVVFTRENRGGSLNTQHAQHRSVQATDRWEGGGGGLDS